VKTLMRPRNRTLVWFTAIGLSFVVTHVPPGKQPIPPLEQDKTLHVLGFAALGALTIWRIDAAGQKVCLITGVAWFLGLSSYGAFDELTQPIAGRSCEFADWLADAAGSATGIGLALAYRHKRLSRLKLREGTRP
jgi:VanZ family protein